MRSKSQNNYIFSFCALGCLLGSNTVHAELVKPPVSGKFFYTNSPSAGSRDPPVEVLARNLKADDGTTTEYPLFAALDEPYLGFFNKKMNTKAHTFDVKQPFDEEQLGILFTANGDRKF